MSRAPTVTPSPARPASGGRVPSGADAQADVTGGLRAGRYRFVFEVLEALRLTDAQNTLPGPTLRGALGSVLRRTACLTGAPTCEGCTLRPECAYGFPLDTVLPPGHAAAARYRTPPRPFVLHLVEPGRTAYAPGEQLRFEVLLLGRAAAYVPHLAYALRALEDAGLGASRRRGRVRLTAVRAVQPAAGEDARIPVGENGLARPAPPPQPLAALAAQDAPPAGGPVELTFVTPLRLKHGGGYVDADRFALPLLARALARRLTVLARCYGPATSPRPDLDALAAAARRVRLTRLTLRWEAHRRTSRRGRKIRTGGLVGRVALEGEALGALGALRPLLAAGQILHAGEKTVRGLGQYALRPPS